MENIKRKRERTFEYSEKSVLLDIVTKHYNLIESKKTDAVGLKTKNAEWVKIAEQFAAASSIYPRDVLTLKTLWENFKRKAKLAIAAQADNHYGTGGGKAKKIINDPLVDIVIGLIRPHIEPFSNIYDDNNDDTLTKTISNFYEDVVEEDATEEIVINDFGDNEVTNNDWSQYNPTMLKSPLSAALRQPTSTSTSNYLADSKKIEDLKHTAPASPNNLKSLPSLPINVDKKDASRRRPILKTSASETLLEARIASLDAASMDAREEHKIQMQILEEKLKQEKIKTELLKLQMQREMAMTIQI